MGRGAGGGGGGGGPRPPPRLPPGAPPPPPPPPPIGSSPAGCSARSPPIVPPAALRRRRRGTASRSNVEEKRDDLPGRFPSTVFLDAVAFLSYPNDLEPRPDTQWQRSDPGNVYKRLGGAVPQR